MASGRRARVRRITVAMLVGVAAMTSCGLPSAAPEVPPSTRAQSAAPMPTAPKARGPVRIVALGDSVTSGYHCHCTAFPELYAAALGTRRRVHATATNLGVPGLTSGELLAELTGSTTADARTQDAVAAARVVVVTIGANNFSDKHDPITAGTCAGAKHTACTRDELTTMTRTVPGVVDRIRTVRDGAPTTIMLTGYWNVFEDGDVADKAFPDEGVSASVALTKEANAGIRKDALAENAIYVDLYPVFDGANSDKDPTGLLASDGDHPNAAGHAAIAHQLLADTPAF
ncbi:MAG TPA: SGNH/GDSL hydrolase family protein [Actinopolymorphaceae bacterium]